MDYFDRQVDWLTLGSDSNGRRYNEKSLDNILISKVFLGIWW